MTRDELLALPAVVDVPTAGRAYGVGRDLAYTLARTGAFPVPVLRLGPRLRVRTAHLLADLFPNSSEAPVSAWGSATPGDRAAATAGES